MTVFWIIALCVAQATAILTVTALVGAWQRARTPCHCGRCDRCKLP